MKTFIASDLHINHRNILQYCPHRFINHKIRSEAIDEDVEIMNRLIIENWNSVVSQEDEVYCLGDICMGQIIKAPSYIRQLNGKKYLVKGNHDKTLHKLIKNNEEYSDLFQWIRDYYFMNYKTSEGKKVQIAMSHFPFASWDGMNQGSIHTHGHLHGSKHNVTGRIFDVGIDTNNLKPYLLDDVVHQMLKIEVIRSHHD